ncbi:hypothetical protein EJ05DRAFT_355685 [Pseudovirgaria hyperparasitica]|uniref:Uncharacterized protein n=1 Tax=Pseudovirgaria hyperparasitica TaxID=470096 RepID=A0A6A6W6S1_9PEZI|nr:uncharacterized protein EJ05DRAFT_355685 [Pseudovirgaria hyperparasitica]KAF2758562.1 hypothetical protein EJ05DRAFT_355685 [Pseudovirgaria hyperparasitica]
MRQPEHDTNCLDETPPRTPIAAILTLSLTLSSVQPQAIKLIVLFFHTSSARPAWRGMGVALELVLDPLCRSRLFRWDLRTRPYPVPVSRTPLSLSHPWTSLCPCALTDEVIPVSSSTLSRHQKGEGGGRKRHSFFFWPFLLPTTPSSSSFHNLRTLLPSRGGIAASHSSTLPPSPPLLSRRLQYGKSWSCVAARHVFFGYSTRRASPVFHIRNRNRNRNRTVRRVMPFFCCCFARSNKQC